MEHIKQYDWCSSEPDRYFIHEADVDNSVTERILRNKFHDPLISSDSEDESKPKEKINWDEIFKKKTNDKNPRVIVPGFRKAPPFQKLSALTAHQHLQCLKVLCASNPDILPAQFIGRPTKQDHRVFEEVKEAYAKEQQEFIHWAKSLWASSHCVHALRPKPSIEMVYEAEFKVTAHKMQSFPKNYAVAAQIPLGVDNVLCEMVEEKELINVNISNIPKIKVPDMLSKVFIMNNTYPVPEPCNKHPCRFQLPNESTMTVLPLTEVHRELAQYAADHGACNIASEEALRCLVELDRSWLLAVSVCQVLTQDEPTNVVVLDCDFAVRRESALVRTHKALRRLLAHALVPPNLTSEKRSRSDNRSTPKRSKASDHELESSDDDDNLHIDMDYGHDLNETQEKEEEPKTETANETLSKERRNSLRGGSNKLEFYNCTCRDSFDKPAPRSFRKWKVMNRSTSDRVNLIVHCPHGAKGDSGEVVLEPIPEYQTDLGGSAQSPHAVRSLALAMLLRKDASVLNVRIDGPTGEIVTLEPVSKEDLVKQHSDIMSEVSNQMYVTFDQLQGLLPGHYVLQHEPLHGANAILCRAQSAGAALRLQFECAQLAEADEARSLQAPPALAPVLLPIHKYRRYLPCAFPPFQNLVARAPRRAPPPRKAPPQAIKWPKKKRGRKKKNNNNNN